MRIWHLLSNRWNSAITEYALSSARALKQLGHETIFSPIIESPADERSRAYDLDTRSFETFSLRDIPFFLQLLADSKPDLIMTYGGPETAMTKAAAFAKKVHVIRFRGQEVPEESMIFRLKQRWAHSHIQQLLAPSEDMAKQLRAYESVKPVECVVLGCDEQQFRFDPAVYAQKAARPYALIFGRLDPIKGHDVALAMFARVLSNWSDPVTRPQLHIVGQPANISVRQMERMIASHGFRAGDVELTALRVENVAALLGGATLGLIPSKGSEIICRVAEEFLLCGTPIFVSGAGSLDECLFPGAGQSYRGLDVTAGSIQLGAALRRAIQEDRAQREDRAKKAAELFSLAAMGSKLDHMVSRYKSIGG